MENFGKFMLGLIIVVLTTIVNGFVMITLWGWFIVPTFNVIELRLVEGIGIILFINYLKMRFNDKSISTNNDGFWDRFIGNCIRVIIGGGFVLLFGWIIKLFM